jgi:hypothetical protein
VTQHPETAAVVTKRHKNVTMGNKPEAFVTKQPQNVTQLPATAAVVTKRAEFVIQHNIKAVFGNNPGRNMLEKESTKTHLRGN